MKREFVDGRVSLTCHECSVVVRREEYQKKQFATGEVHKEMIVRKRDLKDFILTQANFQTLPEYNNYLEMVEDFAFNLVNGMDVVETRARIQAFVRDHRDQIERARSLRMRENEVTRAYFVEHEKEVKERRENAQAQKEREQQENRHQNEQLLKQVAQTGKVEVLKPALRADDARKRKAVFGEEEVAMGCVDVCGWGRVGEGGVRGGVFYHPLLFPSNFS